MPLLSQHITGIGIGGHLYNNLNEKTPNNLGYNIDLQHMSAVRNICFRAKASYFPTTSYGFVQKYSFGVGLTTSIHNRLSWNISWGFGTTLFDNFIRSEERISKSGNLMFSRETEFNVESGFYFRIKDSLPSSIGIHFYVIEDYRQQGSGKTDHGLVPTISLSYNYQF